MRASAREAGRVRGQRNPYALHGAAFVDSHPTLDTPSSRHRLDDLSTRHPRPRRWRAVLLGRAPIKIAASTGVHDRGLRRGFPPEANRISSATTSPRCLRPMPFSSMARPPGGIIHTWRLRMRECWRLAEASRAYSPVFSHSCVWPSAPGKLFHPAGQPRVRLDQQIYGFYDECKRRYNIKMGRPSRTASTAAGGGHRRREIFAAMAAFGLQLDQIKKIVRPTDVLDTGLLCDLLWSDPDKDMVGWGENDRAPRHVRRGHRRAVPPQDGLGPGLPGAPGRRGRLRVLRAKALVTIFSAPNYCGEFDNAGMMAVDETLMCPSSIPKPAESEAPGARGCRSGPTPPARKGP